MHYYYGLAGVLAGDDWGVGGVAGAGVGLAAAVDDESGVTVDAGGINLAIFFSSTFAAAASGEDGNC